MTGSNKSSRNRVILWEKIGANNGNYMLTTNGVTGSAFSEVFPAKGKLNFRL
jgi:hypothetical protein